MKNPAKKAKKSTLIRVSKTPPPGWPSEEEFKEAAHSGEGEKPEANIVLAGRLMSVRVMGKASFATIQDGSVGSHGGRIQLYVTRDALGEDFDFLQPGTELTLPTDKRDTEVITRQNDGGFRR